MTIECLGIDLPQELQLFEYQNVKRTVASDKILTQCLKIDGTNIVKNDRGEIDYIEYYNDCGDLSKRVYYKGTSIIQEKNYRYNYLISEENYIDNYILSSILYDKNGAVKLSYEYEYNQEKQIISITKKEYDKCYKVKYGYDGLGRVNYRKVIINGATVKEQHYKINILDKIVEYMDNTQKICVFSVASNGQLLAYKITDKNGNEIHIKNNINYGEYINTYISLNGHETIVKNSQYVENPYLKRPSATQEDLNQAILGSQSRNVNQQPVKVKTKDVISDSIINRKLNQGNSLLENKPVTTVLPISMRKLALYKSVVKKQTKTA